MIDHKEKYIANIKTLNETIWEGLVTKPQIDNWLSNFKDDVDGTPSEQLHALCLLSQFMYFGSRQIRELLKALFRDSYKYPIVESIRKANGDTTDVKFLSNKFNDELAKTRFVGIGNPSGSGSHLLYYFRQENQLPEVLFINSRQILKKHGRSSPPTLHFPNVRRYVFIDDICGSGTQAKTYSEKILKGIKSITNEDIRFEYYMLFSTKKGLEKIDNETLFDKSSAVFELDDSYKCFGSESRYFLEKDNVINKSFAKDMCNYYGKILNSSGPLGFKNGQLLIGFHHNTPNNTLPIIWHDSPTYPKWTSIFKRYPKA
ncbi:MAG: phosphoribosyltransferase-like protein [Candidatus Scalindua sp.]